LAAFNARRLYFRFVAAEKRGGKILRKELRKKYVALVGNAISLSREFLVLSYRERLAILVLIPKVKVAGSFAALWSSGQSQHCATCEQYERHGAPNT